MSSGLRARETVASGHAAEDGQRGVPVGDDTDGGGVLLRGGQGAADGSALLAVLAVRAAQPVYPPETRPVAVTYRFSRRAKAFAHIKCPDGVFSGSTASRLLCGMCDCSDIGDWQEVDNTSAIPIHLVLHPLCLERARSLGLIAREQGASALPLPS